MLDVVSAVDFCRLWFSDCGMIIRLLKILPAVHLKRLQRCQVPDHYQRSSQLAFQFLVRIHLRRAELYPDYTLKSVSSARVVFYVSAMANRTKTPLTISRWISSCHFRKMSFLSETVNKNENFSVTVETWLSVEVRELLMYFVGASFHWGSIIVST